MGASDLVPPAMPEGHVCECGLGPLGEQVYWIRPQSERSNWFVGGNPIETKKIESRAYFMFSERSEKNPMITWLAFEDALRGRPVRKVMCTRVDGADPTTIGFVDPDELDAQRITYLTAASAGGATRNNKVYIDTTFDLRFLAKLGVGISCCLFGSKVLDSAYGKELHKALQYKEGDDIPNIRGTPLLSPQANASLNDLAGHPHAVTVLVIPSREGVFVNLNIGTHLNWTVMAASRDALDAEDLAQVQDGFVVILYRALQKAFCLQLPEYLAHKTGLVPLPELAAIDARAEKHADYFRLL